MLVMFSKDFEITDSIRFLSQVTQEYIENTLGQEVDVRYYFVQSKPGQFEVKLNTLYSYKKIIGTGRSTSFKKALEAASNNLVRQINRQRSKKKSHRHDNSLNRKVAA